MFNRYLLSTYYVIYTMLRVGNTVKNKTWRKINRLLLRAMRQTRVRGGGSSKKE